MSTDWLAQRSGGTSPQSLLAPQIVASRMGSPPGTDWWLLSAGSLTHCPGLSLGPARIGGLGREPVRVTGARLAGKKRQGYNQTKIYGSGS